MTARPLLLLALAACTAGKDDPPDTGDTGPGGDTTDTADTADTTDTTDTTPRLAWFPGYGAVDVTPDGATVLFQDLATLDGQLFLLDTATDTLSYAATLGDATRNQATGLSAGLAISALHGVPIEAGRWTPDAGWLDLPSPFEAGCDADHAGAFDLSDDGAVVVGLMWDGCAPAAFRWTEAGGTQVLDTVGEAYEGSPSPPTNRASVVSSDGRVAAGFAQYGALDRSPARWTEDGAGTLLAPEDREQPGEVLSIDADGSTLGVLRGVDGYRWTVEAGFEPLGRLDTMLPSDPVYPLATSPDGAVIFGGVGSEFFTVPVAFVWSAEAGMRPLADVVAAAGVVPEAGWLFTSVTAVSDDLTVLTGRGFDADFMPTTWVMHVPAGSFGG